MRTRTHHAATHRLVSALASVLVAVPLLLSSFGQVAPVRADDLSDARARQAQLQQSIEQQRRLLVTLRSNQQSIKRSLGSTATKLDTINVNQADLRTEIDNATVELDGIQKQYDTLVSQIGKLDWTLNLLQDELDHGEKDLSDRRTVLAARLAEAYRTQQTSLLEQMLSNDSLSDVFSDVDSYLRFGDQDKQLAAQIQQDQDAVRSLRSLTTATRYRTNQLRLEARQQAIEIASQRRDLQKANIRLQTLEAKTRNLQLKQLAGFTTNVKNQDQAATDLANQTRAEALLRDKVAALIAAAKKRAAEEAKRRAAEWRRTHQGPPPVPNGPDPGPSSNGPLNWPTAGVITQEFGCTGFSWEPPRGSCSHYHTGIDIASSAGTPIRAAAAGQIIFSGYNPYDDPHDPAWIVIISHANDITTWYAHMEPKRPAGASVGSNVSSGQLIGYMGNTGHSTGTHLHWQVEVNSVPVNPRRYL